MRAAAPTRCVSSGTHFGLRTGRSHAGVLASRGNRPARPSDCHPRGGVVGGRALPRLARHAVRSSPSDAAEPAGASAEEPAERSVAADSMPANAPRGSPRGYFRWPALYGNLLVFVCEDDLHSADAKQGGVPRRLTDTPGPARAPVFSPDGAHVAFTVAEDECEEVYVVRAEGGIQNVNQEHLDQAKSATKPIPLGSFPPG